MSPGASEIQRLKQLRAVDVGRLDELAGRLAAPELRAVDEALALVLGLS